MIPGFASWPEFAYKVRADDLDHERAKKDAHSVVVARTPPLKADAWHGARGLSDSCKMCVPRVPCVPPTLEAPVYKGFAAGTPKMKNRNTS